MRYLPHLRGARQKLRVQLMSATPKLPCTRPNCEDPFCDREHSVTCVSCHYSLGEEDAVETKAGTMCVNCAERHYPVIDNGDNRWPM